MLLGWRIKDAVFIFRNFSLLATDATEKYSHSENLSMTEDKDI